MRNGGIIQSAITNKLPLELDYRLPCKSVEFWETSGDAPTRLEYAAAEIWDEFQHLLSAI